MLTILHTNPVGFYQIGGNTDSVYSDPIKCPNGVRTITFNDSLYDVVAFTSELPEDKVLRLENYINDRPKHDFIKAFTAFFTGTRGERATIYLLLKPQDKDKEPLITMLRYNTLSKKKPKGPTVSHKVVTYKDYLMHGNGSIIHFITVLCAMYDTDTMNGLLLLKMVNRLGEYSNMKVNITLPDSITHPDASSLFITDNDYKEITSLLSEKL